jgi:hypothetical protein
MCPAELRPEKDSAGEAQKQLKTTDRPLVRESAPHKQPRNCLKKIIKQRRRNVGRGSQMGA